MCPANGDEKFRLTRATASHPCVKNLSLQVFAPPPFRAPQRSLQTVELHSPHSSLNLAEQKGAHTSLFKESSCFINKGSLLPGTEIEALEYGENDSDFTGVLSLHPRTKCRKQRTQGSLGDLALLIFI